MKRRDCSWLRRRRVEEGGEEGRRGGGRTGGGEEGRRRLAQRPQGLLGRGQPISLSLINSSRGDCNTAGDCWEKEKKKDGGRGGENEVGMNGKVWSGGEGTEPQDERKIGKKEGKWG